MRWLFSTRQVTASIDVHDYAGLTLRPPGVKGGTTPEADLLKQVGATINEPVGYENVAAWQLYATTGTSMDWTYLDVGTLSFSYELGLTGFHPGYGAVVREYYGRPGTDSDGKGGVREGFLRLVAAAADPSLHSVLTGTRPEGTRLVLRRTSTGSTSGGQTFRNVVTSQLDAKAGAFRWQINPSTPPKLRVSDPDAVVAWTLRCEKASDGSLIAKRTVRVERGGTLALGNPCTKA